MNFHYRTFLLLACFWLSSCDETKEFPGECQFSGNIKSHFMEQGMIVYRDSLQNGFQFDRSYYFLYKEGNPIPYTICNESDQTLHLPDLPDSARVLFTGYSLIFPPSVDYLTIPVSLNYIKQSGKE